MSRENIFGESRELTINDLPDLVTLVKSRGWGCFSDRQLDEVWQLTRVQLQMGYCASEKEIAFMDRIAAAMGYLSLNEKRERGQIVTGGAFDFYRQECLKEGFVPENLTISDLPETID